MHNSAASCLLTLAFIATGAAQERPEPIPLANLKLNLDPLKMRGVQRYTYDARSPDGKTEAGKGTITFATEVDGDNVILRDTMDLVYQGTRLTLKLIHRCQPNNFLTPTKIESKGEGEEVATFTATIEDGKATVTFEGKERVIEVPPDTVTFSAFVRLLPLLPREEKMRITFPHWLESSELNAKKNFVVECLGDETLKRGEQEINCTKYRLTLDQIMPMDAWIDSDRVLQRLLIDGRKVIDLVEE